MSTRPAGPLPSISQLFPDSDGKFAHRWASPNGSSAPERTTTTTAMQQYPSGSPYAPASGASAAGTGGSSNSYYPIWTTAGPTFAATGAPNDMAGTSGPASPDGDESMRMDDNESLAGDADGPTGKGGKDNAKKRKRHRTALSCAECKRRKIKCDRKIPCEACIRRGEGDSCHWEDKAKEPPPQPFALASDVEYLLRRLEHLEFCVSKLPKHLVPHWRGPETLPDHLPVGSVLGGGRRGSQAIKMAEADTPPSGDAASMDEIASRPTKSLPSSATSASAPMASHAPTVGRRATGSHLRNQIGVGSSHGVIGTASDLDSDDEDAALVLEELALGKTRRSGTMHEASPAGPATGSTANGQAGSNGGSLSPAVAHRQNTVDGRKALGGDGPLGNAAGGTNSPGLPTGSGPFATAYASSSINAPPAFAGPFTNIDGLISTDRPPAPDVLLGERISRPLNAFLAKNLAPTAAGTKLSWVNQQLLSVLLGLLPRREVADAMLERYFVRRTKTSPTLWVFYEPDFRKSYANMWDVLDRCMAGTLSEDDGEGSVESLDPLWISGYLQALTLTAFTTESGFPAPTGMAGLRAGGHGGIPGAVVPPDDANESVRKEVYPGVTVEELQKVGPVWFEASQLGLMLGGWLTVPRATTIQTILHLFPCLQFMADAKGGAVDKVIVFLSAGIRIAQLMGLHMLGDDEHNKMPPDDPAWPPGENVRKREIGKRLWHGLLFADAMLGAYARVGVGSIIRDGEWNTALPGNFNDSDLTLEARREPRPLEEMTDVSTDLCKMRLGMQQRACNDIAGPGKHPTYQQILELDAGFLSIYETVPLVFRPSARTDDENPLLTQRRQAMDQGICYRRIRVHRRHVHRGLRDPKYQRSVDACKEAAERIIATHAWPSVGRPYTHHFAVLHLLNAVSILAVMAFHWVEHWNEPNAERFCEDTVREFDRVAVVHKSVASEMHPSMLKAAELSEVIITRLAAEIRGAMERARAGLAPTAGKSSRETLSTVVNRIVDAFAEEPSSLQSSPVDAPSGPGSTPNTSSRPSNRPPHSKRGSGIWDSFNWFAPSGGTDGSPQGDDAGGQINKADFTPDAVAQFLSNFAGNGGAAMTSENGSTTSGGGYQSSGQGDPNAPGLDWNNMQIFGGSGVTDWMTFGVGPGTF